MNKYKVTNRITTETQEVAANSAQERQLGWMIDYQEVQC